MFMILGAKYLQIYKIVLYSDILKKQKLKENNN